MSNTKIAWREYFLLSKEEREDENNKMNALKSYVSTGAHRKHLSKFMDNLYNQLLNEIEGELESDEPDMSWADDCDLTPQEIDSILNTSTSIDTIYDFIETRNTRALKKYLDYQTYKAFSDEEKAKIDTLYNRYILCDRRCTKSDIEHFKWIAGDFAIESGALQRNPDLLLYLSLQEVYSYNSSVIEDVLFKLYDTQPYKIFTDRVAYILDNANSIGLSFSHFNTSRAFVTNGLIELYHSNPRLFTRLVDAVYLTTTFTRFADISRIVMEIDVNTRCKLMLNGSIGCPDTVENINSLCAYALSYTLSKRQLNYINSKPHIMMPVALICPELIDKLPKFKINSVDDLKHMISIDVNVLESKKAQKFITQLSEDDLEYIIVHKGNYIKYIPASRQTEVMQMISVSESLWNIYNIEEPSDKVFEFAQSLYKDKYK